MPFLKKRPWIAIALVVACICMWGCGLLDEEVNHVVDSKRYNGIVFACAGFIYMCIYLEGWGENSVDLYLEDVRKYTENFTKIVIYEWNIFQHHPDLMNKCLYDIDGVLCVEPPDERNEEQYVQYIKNAIPLFIPRTKIGGIITYRLIKNLDITQKWLNDNGIKYNELTMFNAKTTSITSTNILFFLSF